MEHGRLYLVDFRLGILQTVAVIMKAVITALEMAY